MISSFNISVPDAVTGCSVNCSCIFSDKSAPIRHTKLTKYKNLKAGVGKIINFTCHKNAHMCIFCDRYSQECGRLWK